MCKCFSSASVGTVFEHLYLGSGSVWRHVQALQLRQRGHRVRAPLAAACGAMCMCFSSASVGTVFENS
jgi:hypothetical protein